MNVYIVDNTDKKVYDYTGPVIKNDMYFLTTSKDNRIFSNHDSMGKWSFVNSDGKTAIEAKFDVAMSFFNGLAVVRSGDKWGFINDNGELVINNKYSDGGYFTNDGTCFVGFSDEQMYMILLRFKGE